MNRTPKPTPAETVAPATVRVETLTVGTHLDQPFRVGTILTVSAESAEHLVAFGIARLAEDAPAETVRPADPTT